MGRKPIYRKPMSPTQRQRRHRLKAKHAAIIAKRAVREAEFAARTRAAPSLLTMPQRYGVLYADPPWRFEPRSRITGMGRAADNHYATLDTAAICALPVPAADDAVLFLWRTAPMLLDALQVMRAWGFDYRTEFIWAKDRVGTGYWNRNRHEVLMLGVRGRVPAPAPGQQWESVIEAAVGRHSAKPEVFASMIEALFPTVPKLELFARGRRFGWDVWGAEAEAEPSERQGGELREVRAARIVVEGGDPLGAVGG